MANNWTSEVKGRLGFGCMRLPEADGGIDYGEMNRMVDAFLSAGFNYFDTARPYHGGKSEIALRECLVKRYPRERFFIADKLSSSTWKSEADIDAVLDSELESLGVEYMDMLLMHAQNAAENEKYEKHHAYEHAATFKAAGKTRHVGISFHDSPEVLERIMIPEMFGALNTKRVFGGWNPGWYYSNSLIAGDHGRASDCIECGKCEKACPQKLPIRQLLKEVSREFD